MQIFIDSADLDEIIEINHYGIIDGVTTNPTLISKTGKNFFQTVQNICNIINGPISVEVLSNDYNIMKEEGEKILNLHENIVLKLPVTWDGIRLCRYFSLQGKNVNMTLCFTANQAVIAAKAGASYISPFIGRLEDISYNGLELISEIKQIYTNYPNLKTQILAASIRNTYQVLQAAKIGVNIVTIPAKIIKLLIEHPLTIQGLNIFTRDSKKVITV